LKNSSITIVGARKEGRRTKEKGGAIMRQLIVLAIVVIYWGVPVDLIPDVIPVAGQIDDVLVTILGLLGMK
jgi:uncharacterized membrane protein YkvA (DUF1232 family)